MFFISLTSSTVPFSQVAMMRRCSPCINGTLVTFLMGTKLVSGFGVSAVLISIKVRRQLFLQKLQRVFSLRVVRYSILRTASRPTKLVWSPFRHRRKDSCAAQIGRAHV